MTSEVEESQGSSQAVTGSTGVNGLKRVCVQIMRLLHQIARLGFQFVLGLLCSTCFSVSLTVNVKPTCKLSAYM